MKTAHPVIAGILLLAIHAILASLSLYQQYPVLDIPMHFFGGVIVAWFFVAYVKSEQHKMSRLAWLVCIIGGTALVGVVWEFYEWAMDTFVFPETQFMGGLNDTLFDLAMDLLGACVVTTIMRRK